MGEQGRKRKKTITIIVKDKQQQTFERPMEQTNKTEVLTLTKWKKGFCNSLNRMSIHWNKELGEQKNGISWNINVRSNVIEFIMKV